MTSKRVFTLCSVLLLCLCLLFTGCGKAATPLPEPLPPAETAAAPETTEATDTGFFLSISEAYALSLLTDALPAGTPYTIDSLDFSAPDTVTVAGTVNLKTLYEKYDMPSTVSAFLPSAIPFRSSCAMAFAPATGFALKPLSLEVTGFTIPIEVLPASLYDYFAKGLNDHLATLPVTIRSVTMTDDAINIAG